MTADFVGTRLSNFARISVQLYLLWQSLSEVIRRLSFSRQEIVLVFSSKFSSKEDIWEANIEAIIIKIKTNNKEITLLKDNEAIIRLQCTYGI